MRHLRFCTVITVALSLAACGPSPAVDTEVDRNTVEKSPQERMAQMTLELLSDVSGVAAGAPDAPVSVHLLSDYQCPACRTATRQFIPAFKETYVETGQVRLTHVDFPLTHIHANAFVAAQAAWCAGEQNEYWAFHDHLFDSQPEWGRQEDPVATLSSYARDLGLMVDEFDECLESGRYADTVQKNLDTALAVGARGTPTFIVNGRQVLGSGREVIEAVEAELARVTEVTGK